MGYEKGAHGWDWEYSTARKLERELPLSGSILWSGVCALKMSLLRLHDAAGYSG